MQLKYIFLPGFIRSARTTDDKRTERMSLNSSASIAENPMLGTFIQRATTFTFNKSDTINLDFRWFRCP